MRGNSNGNNGGSVGEALTTPATALRRWQGMLMRPRCALVTLVLTLYVLLFLRGGGGGGVEAPPTIVVAVVPPSTPDVATALAAPQRPSTATTRVATAAPPRPPSSSPSSPPPVAAGTRPPLKWYCLLPVGDSLTQGVGTYGSYRAPLHSRLSVAATSVARVGFTGTNQYPCTPKRPGTRFLNAPKSADDRSYHEGYCNWDSGSIRRQVEGNALAFEAPYRTAAGDCGGGATGQPVRYHTALLLMGHNDVFRAARGCRVPEQCAVTWVPKDSVHDTGIHSIDLPETLAPHMRCAIANLRKHFKPNLYNLSASLLRRASLPPSAVTRWLGFGGAPALVIGKNPPTGFPCLDLVLMKLIDEVVSDLRAVFDVPVKGQDGSWTRRIAVAKFPDFTKGTHTFDSTHPNAQGTELMAEGWMLAIETGVVY